MTFQFKADALRTDRALPVPAACSRDDVIQCEPLRPMVRHYSLGIPACLVSDNGPCLGRVQITVAIDPITRLVVAFDCNASAPTRQIAPGARPGILRSVDR